VLAIPDQGTVSVEVIETGRVERVQGIHIAPSRESWIEGKPETPYIENEESYGSESVYPDDTGKTRDRSYFINYNPDQLRIRCGD
jgi:hypothetical protein